MQIRKMVLINLEGSGKVNMKLTLTEATQIVQEDFDLEVFTQISDQCVDILKRIW